MFIGQIFFLEASSLTVSYTPTIYPTVYYPSSSQRFGCGVGELGMVRAQAYWGGELGLGCGCGLGLQGYRVRGVFAATSNTYRALQLSSSTWYFCMYIFIIGIFTGKPLNQGHLVVFRPEQVHPVKCIHLHFTANATSTIKINVFIEIFAHTPSMFVCLSMSQYSIAQSFTPKMWQTSIQCLHPSLDGGRARVFLNISPILLLFLL